MVASFNEVFYLRRRDQVKRSTISRISVMSSIGKRTPSWHFLLILTHLSQNCTIARRIHEFVLCLYQDNSTVARFEAGEELPKAGVEFIEENGGGAGGRLGETTKPLGMACPCLARCLRNSS